MHPVILTLDEARNAFDAASVISRSKSIERLHGGMTITAVTHRLSTVLSADRVLVMDRSQIVGQGNARELSQSDHLRFSRVGLLQAPSTPTCA
jgi:ABC-type multidrug transport system fused ATPase/permease subunit